MVTLLYVIRDSRDPSRSREKRDGAEDVFSGLDRWRVLLTGATSCRVAGVAVDVGRKGARDAKSRAEKEIYLVRIVIGAEDEGDVVNYGVIYI